MTLLTGGKAYRNGVLADVFVLVSETSSCVLPVSEADSDMFSDVSEKIEKLTEHLGTTAEEMARRIPEMSGLLNLKIDAEEREELIDRVAGAGNYANSPYIITRGEMSDIYSRLFG